MQTIYSMLNNNKCSTKDKSETRVKKCQKQETNSLRKWYLSKNIK